MTTVDTADLDLDLAAANNTGGGAAIGAALDDGRRARRQRNRDTVVEAMLTLFRAGNLAPAVDEIAGQAGVSPRSVFRYFDDFDDLCRVAISHQLAHIRTEMDVRVDPLAPFAARVVATANQRVRLYEAIAAVGVVARLRAPFQPLIAVELKQKRALLRHQLHVLFAPEIAALGAADGASALAAADVICSFEGYRLLRDDQGLAIEAATTVLADALTSLLTPAQPGPTDQEIQTT